MMRRISILALLGGLALAGGTAMAEEWSADFKRGWCAGYAAAVENVLKNRDRINKTNLGNFAPETHEQALERIFKRDGFGYPPRVDGKPPEETKNSHIEHTTGIMLDAIDLYIVLPKIDGRVTIYGVDSLQEPFTPAQELDCSVH